MQEEAKAFRGAVRSHQRKRSGKAVRYSHELRRRAVAFSRAARAEGVSLLQCSRLLGVGYKSLHRWMRVETTASVALRPVEIAIGAEDGTANGCLVLVTPGGFRIEGFTRQDLAALVRILP